MKTPRPAGRKDQIASSPEPRFAPSRMACLQACLRARRAPRSFRGSTFLMASRKSSFHFLENAFALHFLFQHTKGLINIVVSYKDFQLLRSEGFARERRRACTYRPNARAAGASRTRNQRPTLVVDVAQSSVYVGIVGRGLVSPTVRNPPTKAAYQSESTRFASPIAALVSVIVRRVAATIASISHCSSTNRERQPRAKVANVQFDE